MSGHWVGQQPVNVAANCPHPKGIRLTRREEGRLARRGGRLAKREVSKEGREVSKEGREVSKEGG